MAMGTGGAAGSGPRPLRCTGSPPIVPLITDFEDAGSPSPGLVVFGTPPRLTGKTFTGASPGVAAPQLSLVAGVSGKRALSVSRPPNPTPMSSSDFYEFGLLFDDCVDARGFQAIQFTVLNSGPACQVQFSVISRPSVTSAKDPRGTCALAPCDPPPTSIVLSGMLRVPISAVASPFVDPASIIGLRWRVPDGCGTALTIDDLTFVNP